MTTRGAEADLAGAAAVWAGFPVTAVPRPYVLVQPAVIQAGYRTGEAKMAFHQGRLRFAAGVPAAAVRALVAGGAQLSPGEPRLLVQDAVRIRHPFRTDRGERELPAWSLQVEGSVGPVIVLDDDEPGASWHPSDPRYAQHWYSSDTATLAADEVTLTYRFTGSPSIYTDYPAADLHQATTAIVVAPRAVDRPGSGARLLYAETRVITVALRRPLGPRVLLNDAGLAVAVTTASQAS
jgi:hypothetical protein